MKKVTYFHLPTCPYCIRADKILAELIAERPEFAAVEFERINEMEQPELADQYDYYANPSMFIGKEKIYECRLFESPDETRRHVLEVLERAMEA